MHNKRGIEPIISVVLLIAFAIVLFLLVSAWIRSSIVDEATSKTEEKLSKAVDSWSVNSEVRQVSLNAPNKIKLSIENTGSKSISDFKVKIVGTRGIDIVDFGEGANELDIKTKEITFDNSKTGTVFSVEIYPVVDGETYSASSGEKDLAPVSCSAILAQKPGSGSGVYDIYPNGNRISVYCDMTTDGGGWTVLISHPIKHTTYDPFVDYGTVSSDGEWSIWSKSSLISYSEILYKPSFEPLQWASMTTAQPAYFKWTDASGKLYTRQAKYSTAFNVGRTNYYSTGCDGYIGTGAYGLMFLENPASWCYPDGSEVGFGLSSGDPRGCHRDGVKWHWGTIPASYAYCPIPSEWKSGVARIGVR